MSDNIIHYEITFWWESFLSPLLDLQCRVILEAVSPEHARERFAQVHGSDLEIIETKEMVFSQRELRN